MNHFLLYLLVREAGASLKGDTIRSVRHLHPIVSIALSKGRQARFLVVILATPGPFLYFSETDPLDEVDAPTLKRLYGSKIAKPPSLPTDRIIRLPVDLPGGVHSLAIYLFGSSAKVRVEGPDRIIDSVDTTEVGMPLKRSPRPGRSPLATARHEDIAATHAVPGLEPELAAAFERADGSIDTAALLDFRDALAAGRRPFSLATGGRLGRMGPVPVGHRPSGAEPIGPFDNAVGACAAAGKLMEREAYETILNRLRATLLRHVQRRQHLLEDLRGSLGKAKAHDAGRNEADILAAYQSRVPAGAREVELPDLYAKGETRKIALDPSLPIRVQIERRYRRAAKLERSQDVLQQRIRLVEDQIARVRKALDDAERAATFGESLQLLQHAVRQHRLLRQSPRRVAQEPRQHRRFDLDDAWFVLVGRNDRENDEITFRVATPDDLWLHAQHVPGSHVVLRRSGGQGNPPATVLEAAAAIAAFYSKARHSGLVPVIYTRRKYVRKFRGARPGEVLCEREKTIFVEPGLPGT